MLSVAMIAIVMLPLFVYYQTSVVQTGPGYRCPSGELPPCIGNDPYQILWNGTIPNASPQSIGFVFSDYPETNPIQASSTQTTETLTAGQLVILSIHDRSTTSCAGWSVTDTKSDVWTRQVCSNSGGGDTASLIVFTTFAVGGSTTVTMSYTSSQIFWSVMVGFSGVASVGESKSAHGASTGTVIDTLTLSNPTEPTDVLFSDAMIGGFLLGSCRSVTVTGTALGPYCANLDSFGLGGIEKDGNNGDYKVNSVSETTTFGNCAGACPTADNWAHIIINMKTQRLCAPGYSCINSHLTGNSDIELTSNSTGAAVMLTTTAINMATTASKELLFYENWSSSTIVNNGKGWGWYLTTNATLPTQLNYNPLNDPNVVVVDVRYPTDNIYTYLQRNPGLSLLTASGLGENPGSTNCPQTATIFICDALNSGLGSTGGSLALVLNFTGGSTANANGSSNGFSGQCNGSGSDFTSFCSNFGGYPTSPCPASAFLNCATITFPWFNVQGGSYYLGFWADAAQTGTIDFHARQSGTFSQKANGIYFWVPNTATTSGNPDSGGFFGWLSRTTGIQTLVDGATWVAGQAVAFGNGVVNSAQNAVFGPIMDGIQKALKWLINSLVLFLNTVGSLFGFPTLGTAMFNFFNDLVTTMIQLLLNLATWIVNTGGFVFNTLAFVVILALDTVVLATFTAWSGITSLLNILLNVVDIFFSYGVSISFLLLIDWLWGVTVCWTDGVQGVLAWIDVNLNIFTFGFKLLWRFTEWAWRGIVIVKSFIPTEGGTPQELKDVTPKSSGKAPGGSHGPTHKPKPSEARTVTAGRRQTKKAGAQRARHSFKGFGGFGAGSSGHAAKDKDPMSMLVFLLMIVVMISWLANASFSPWQANFGCPVKLPALTPDPTCHTNVATGFSNAFTVLNNSGIFRVFVPLAIVMFIFYIYKEFTGEDLSETSGNIIRED